MSNQNVSASGKCFRSAVYEHIRIEKPVDRPLRMLNNNFEIYKRVAKKAAKLHTNVIVFPESGLIPTNNKKTLLNGGVASIIPKLNTNLCADYKKKAKKILAKGLDFSSIMKLQDLEKETEKLNGSVVNNIGLLRKASCIALENKMYVVIDLVELQKNGSDYQLFNSAVVFDDNGKLIAKYRKFKLFGEQALTRPKNPEIVTFDTRFGKFGILICFDIMFKEPLTTYVEKEKIDHLIFPTAWYDNEPSLSALSFHSAVAMKYGFNILSANKRNLTLGGFGSGIYTKTGPKVQTSFNNRNLLLIADLPVNASSASDECDYSKKITIDKSVFKDFKNVLNRNVYFGSYNSLQVPISEFNHTKLKNLEGNITNLCLNGICCHLEYKMNDEFNFPQNTYYLLATSRLKQTIVPGEAFFEENCALVLYNKKVKKYRFNSSTRFDRLVLRAQFNTSIIYSNVITNGLQVVPKTEWHLVQKETDAQISFENLQKPITSVSLYGRNYEKDPK